MQKYDTEENLAQDTRQVNVFAHIVCRHLLLNVPGFQRSKIMPVLLINENMYLTRQKYVIRTLIVDCAANYN